MFTLLQLRCLLAVVDTMSFRRAAVRLHMTQPPLSRQIQALEHALGTALFDRSSRPIRLTPAGQSFARSARRLLEEAGSAVREARRIAKGDAGSVTIAFTAASSYVFLPRLVASLRRSLPNLALSLQELTTPQQLAALQSNQVDFGLLRPPVSVTGVQATRVYREGLLLAVPRDHRLATQEAVGLDELTSETLITYPPVEGPYFHRLIAGLLHVRGVTPAGLQHITQTHSILALVGAGLGVALLPQSVERFCPADIVLKTVETLDGVNADLMLAWRSQSENPACAAVLEVLQAESR
jgi:DNA-binding transcriptional LysR family regulator